MTNTWLGPSFAFLSSVTWAVGSSGYSQLSRTHSAFSINFSRALVALPLFFIAVFVSSGGWHEGLAAFSQVHPRHFGWFTLSMIASYGLGDVLFLWSTRSLGVPGALAIASSYPIWTALGGPSNLQQVFGLVLAVGGVIIVILNGPAVAQSRAHPEGSTKFENLLNQRRVGVALAFATSLAWALNSLSVSRGGSDLSTPVCNTIRMFLALGLCSGISMLTVRKFYLPLPLTEFKRWMWLLVMEAFGGSYFYMYGLSHSPLMIGSTLSSLAPVLAVPVAWILQLEKISFLRTLGVGLVVTGLWLLMSASSLAIVL